MTLPETLREQVAAFLFALQFLTRIPIPAAVTFSPQREQGAVGYYPLVGLVVGLLAAFVWYLAQWFTPPIVAILLSMASTILITGAFHEDGLADTFDGIGGGHNQAQILRIMKDSRLGTYGSVALWLMLSLKAAMLFYLSVSGLTLVVVLIAAHGLSRLSSVLVIMTSQYVRDEGTAKPTAEGVEPAGKIVLLSTTLLLIGISLSVLPMITMLGGLSGLLAGHVCSRLCYARKVGGYTGDCLGATQQFSELAFYLGVLICL